LSFIEELEIFYAKGFEQQYQYSMVVVVNTCFNEIRLELSPLEKESMSLDVR